MRFTKDRLYGLKINKAKNANLTITRSIMSSLLTESYDSFNFGHPLETKFIVNVVDYVIENFPHEALNDWAGFCYKLSIGELLLTKVYRLGQAELIQLWRDFVDQKWARVEANHNKRKEQLSKHPVLVTDAYAKIDKEGRERIEAMLNNWRKDRVRETINSEKAKTRESGPLFNEKEYIKNVLYLVLKLTPNEIASLCYKYVQAEKTTHYLSKIRKVLSQEKANQVIEAFFKMANESNLNEATKQVFSDNFKNA